MNRIFNKDNRSEILSFSFVKQHRIRKTIKTFLYNKTLYQNTIESIMSVLIHNPENNEAEKQYNEAEKTINVLVQQIHDFYINI